MIADVTIVRGARLIVIAAAVGLSIAGALPSAAEAKCNPKVLSATDGLHDELAATHRAYLDLNDPAIGMKGPVGRVYYGRCRGRSYYALAAFRHVHKIDGIDVNFDLQDQPEAFRQSPGGSWKDLDDTGSDPFGGDVPTALLKAWKYRFVWK